MPPDLRRKTAALREWSKYEANQSLPINGYMMKSKRLKSRKPAFITVDKLIAENFDGKNTWRQQWNTLNPDKHALITCPTAAVKGFDLPRKEWVQLNRIRTGQGRCNDLLTRWNIKNDAVCDCGYPHQTINHIVRSCPGRAFDGTLHEIHEVSTTALSWLQNLKIIL